MEPAVFPGRDDLAFRQGQDFSKLWTWYTDSPRDAVYRGDWDATRIYGRADLARAGGAVYAALVRTVGNTPGVSPTEWRPLTVKNLTGFTARLQVREGVGSASPLLTLTGSGTTPGGSGLTIGSAGTVTITLGNADTALLPARSLPYDLELVNGSGLVTPFVAGLFIVGAEITR